MALRYCLIALCLVGCATQSRPDYQAVTDLFPDCANRDAQVRYLTKLQRFPVRGNDDPQLYNQTLKIQIERLTYYCQ